MAKQAHTENKIVSADITTALADLTIQSIMFDMDIDLETASLVPRQHAEEVPIWIKKWREKEHGADRKPENYEGGKDER